MHHRLLLFACFFTLLLLVSPTYGDIAYEAGVRGGYTNNLYNDSTDTGDSYSITSIKAKLYPASNLEVNVVGQYTLYNKINNLSNFYYSGQVTYIPSHEDVPYSIYISGNFDRVLYRNEQKEFDNQNLGLLASFGYFLVPTIQARAGTKLTSTSYFNTVDINADYEQFEWFGGLNITFLGSNAFDIEAGYSLMNFDYISSHVQAINPTNPGDSLARGSLHSFYISPRYSRPLGKKTGMSITYSYRNFTNHDDIVIFGFTTGFLSPWASVYDGSSIQLKLKTYLVPHAIISGGMGYWNKTYLKSLEKGIHGYPAPMDAPQRVDELTRVFASIQRPIMFGISGVLEPTLSLDYTHNISNDDRYDFNGITVTVGVTYKR